MAIKKFFVFFPFLLLFSFFIFSPHDAKAQTFIAPTPAASSWNDDPSILISVDDPFNAVACWYDVRRSGALVVDGATRTCDSTFSVSVGQVADCSVAGFNTCEVEAVAVDAGFTQTSNIIFFSIDYSDPTGVAPMHIPVSVDNTTPSVTINSSTDILGGPSGMQEINVNAVIDANNNGIFDDAAPQNNSCAFANNCTLTVAGPFTIGNRWLYYMTARDGAGNFVSTDSTPGSFVVSAVQPPPPTDRPPTANFNYSISNLVVSFTDSSTAGTNPIATWEWKFGDNTPDVISNSPIVPPHTYQHPAEYIVRLTVIDTKGLESYRENRINLLSGTSVPSVPSPTIARILQAPLTCTSLTDCLDAFITFLLVLSTPLLILLIVYAAVVIMIGGSSPSMRNTAINTLRFALIGYIIILLSKVILGVITGALF